MPAGATVAAVSIVRWRPLAFTAAANSAASRAIIGSPPVNTTCRVDGYCSTADMICATVRASPSGFHEAYGVSHHAHRRLQPLDRTKTEGTPVNSPSPCRE